jgi:hypothetical protein
MIRLTEVYRDIVRLNGAPAEMMLFYTLWQSSLWPGWMQHDDHLGEENDTPTKQRKTAIEAINRGELLLHNPVGSELFGAAIKSAVSKCELLGVDVEHSNERDSRNSNPSPLASAAT